MAQYRNIETGKVKTQAEWRVTLTNVSLPTTWTEATISGLGLEPVLRGTPTSVGAYQRSVRDGEEQDSDGNWVERYIAVDLFEDTGVGTKRLVTKEQHEEVYQRGLDDKTSDSNRDTRNKLIAETDWMAMSDVMMSGEVADYRQALRDLPSHINFPNLQAGDWPVKP
tara:strand:+ start:1962 stop:2462 length:501 start_codon:yes stop_codon:yes gene_type:complete